MKQNRLEKKKTDDYYKRWWYVVWGEDRCADILKDAQKHKKENLYYRRTFYECTILV